MTPLDLAFWWWGMCWGSAALAMEPFTAKRPRPAAPTRDALAAELAALPAPSPELARVAAGKPRKRRS